MGASIQKIFHFAPLQRPLWCYIPAKFNPEAWGDGDALAFGILGPGGRPQIQACRRIR